MTDAVTQLRDFETQTPLHGMWATSKLGYVEVHLHPKTGDPLIVVLEPHQFADWVGPFFTRNAPRVNRIVTGPFDA